MNDYRITTTVGTFVNPITAVDEKDARRIFKSNYKGEIATVELFRENVPATKAQEKDALERIRAIVATLGPSSYVGTALDGCLTDAEVNIENDFGDSMKARWMDAERRVVEAVKETTAAKEELARARQALVDAENNADWLSKQLAEAQKQTIADDDLTDVEQLVEGYISRLQDKVKAVEATILDYAEHPETTTFCDAVRERKNLTKDIEYYKALGRRLAALRGQ